MGATDFDFSETANRESWKAMQAFYGSSSGADTHYRYRYIVNRLVDTRVAAQYMIGETFVSTDPDRPKPNHEKSLAEIDADYQRIQSSPNSYGRGLFFTKGPFGIDFSNERFVCVFVNIEGELVAQYCNGNEVIESHFCQSRKEIPCIMSLLKHLDQNAG